MAYKIGLDIGSTTLKAIVLDDHDQIVYKSYERHKSKVRSMTLDKFIELHAIVKDHKIQLSITGSAGLGIANEAGLTFVQEVFACTYAVKKYYPKSECVIELGGEDAKIIFLKGALEERMNSTCAGGTGAFIDQMASLLNISLAKMDEAALSYDTLYPIASRCGVFAKSDVQPLINQGCAKSNLAASIFQAVVDQCITGLAQGRAIKGNVLFLGGPLFFMKGLQLRFKETLKLTDEQAIFPELSPYFVALGSALYALQESTVMTYEEILKKLQLMATKPIENKGLPPLFANDAQYLSFKDRHYAERVPRRKIATYNGFAYLGIDAGSTTTKLVLINEQDEILYEKYTSNQGNPIDVILKELKHIYALCDNHIQIQHSGVTGYGEELMKHAFHIDIGMVETIAHYTAAHHFNPNVDFIIDIGGQDMKCFRIKDHSIDDILLNEACSSGCGSFIETFAESMGYTIVQFAQMGLAGQHPVDLGTRCTVFMNSSVKQAQKNGAKMEDIAAGLCISVVKNALYKVIRAKSLDEIGKEIVVQGGTFLNDTVLRSFEMELNTHVIRPDIAHLMGAYGAALLAKQKQASHSNILNLKQINSFTHKAVATRCQLCNNHCALTINTFQDNTKLIAGNKCERPIAHQKTEHAGINLYAYQYEYLKGLHSMPNKRGKIGIPLGLNMFDQLPFWHSFFTSLEFEVVQSEPSSKNLYALGQHTIPSDTACYPAKLVHGHIQSLINQGIKHIFYPCETYNIDEGISDNHFNCPIVAYYPELIAANMDLTDIRLDTPYIYMSDKKILLKQMCTLLQAYKIPKKTLKQALEIAFEAYEKYHKTMQDQANSALQYAQEHHKKVIVLAGRPYHIDPQVHHGIHKLLTQLNCVVLNEFSLPLTSTPTPIESLNQWTFHARMYNAAAFVSKHQEMELVQLVSFGCGIDAITSDEIKHILRQNNKLYTQIKIDEIDNLGAIKIRIRSLLAAMDERRNANAKG